MPRRRPDGKAWSTLLKDPDLYRWYANVARGSTITADVYLRRLGAFSEQVRVSPSELTRLKEKELHDLLLDFVSNEERKGRTGSYIHSSIKAVKSWLLHHGVRLTLPIRIKGVQETPTLRDERTPTQDELRRIFLSATPRDRISCVLMAHAGLRPEVLGNYLGNDGLRLSDLPELDIRGSKIRFERIPTLVVVRPELSKAGHRYFTFLGEEACGYVVNYLEERLRGDEKLLPDTDLVHPKGVGATGPKPFIRTINIGDGVRKSIRTAGFPWRPYVLRAYFDTQLLLAESKGKVAHDYRVFWMGHKGSMEARYTTNKGRLPQSLVDDMREAYRRCEPFLSTIPSRSDQDNQAKIAKTMLLGLGYTEEELAKVDLENLNVSVFQELVNKKLDASGSDARQKLVDANELPGYLEQGWTVVTAVNGHQVVLNPPGSR